MEFFVYCIYSLFFLCFWLIYKHISSIYLVRFVLYFLFSVFLFIFCFWFVVSLSYGLMNNINLNEEQNFKPTHTNTHLNLMYSMLDKMKNSKYIKNLYARRKKNETNLLTQLQTLLALFKHVYP